MGESKLALPLRRLLAQHQDAGAERWSPLPLKEEEKGARVISGFRDLRSPQAGRLFPSPLCLALICGAGLSSAKEAPFKFQLCCFRLGRVSVTSCSSSSACWAGRRCCPSSHLVSQAAHLAQLCSAAPVLMRRRIINTAGVSSGSGGPGVHVAAFIGVVFCSTLELPSVHEFPSDIIWSLEAKLAPSRSHVYFTASKGFLNFLEHSEAELVTPRAPCS